MKITAQEEYGLRCLLRLARVEGDAALTIPEIAADESLSTPYVAKILGVLRQEGLVESVRGRSGGYRLAREPAEVTLATVMHALGEPLFDEPGYCRQHAGTEADGLCVHHGACTMKELWLTLETWMSRALAGLTLADLLQTEGRITEMLRARLAEAVLETASPLIPLTMLAKDGSE